MVLLSFTRTRILFSGPRFASLAFWFFPSPRTNNQQAVHSLRFHPSLTGIPPLLVLHGGPGVPHNGLRPLRHLATTHSISVILYDQIGCCRSTHLPEKKGDRSFWTVDLFLKELQNLLEHLEIKGEYDLYGHSAGGVLASEWE
jgi:pimeloyl-ACP methyl ester carboxylesterase